MSVESAASVATRVAVRAANAVKVYGEGHGQVRALDDVTVDIISGRFTAIMGPSGSGKSTLLHCLAGLDTLTSGMVELGGVDLSTLNDTKLTKLRREQVGFVFQQYNLVPTLTATENITLPLDLAGRDRDEDWFGQLVGVLGLAERLDHKPAQLSGGEQQRVAAARALIGRPAVVFADEPTGALDSNTGAELLGFLQRAVREFDQTIVMVTHDPVAAAFADQLLFLADGRIVDEMTEPTAERVLDRMKRLEG